MPTVKATVFVLMCCVLLSCSPERKPLRAEKFNWSDSLVECSVSHDHLTIIFPATPEAGSWFVECHIKYDNDYAYSLPPTEISVSENNRLEIDLDLVDSIAPERMYVADLRMKPANGMYMYKTGKGYFMDGLQAYTWSDSTLHRFRLYPYVQEKDWYVIHDSLLYGKDSTWYQTQFALFTQDSCVGQP